MAKKRSMADLPAASRPGVSVRDVMSPKQLRRFDELIDEYLELRRLGRAPALDAAIKLVTQECGVPVGLTTFKRELAKRG